MNGKANKQSLYLFDTLAWFVYEPKVVTLIISIAVRLKYLAPL